MSKIYLASSWRNKFQPELVEFLRAESHAVYDFKNPRPKSHGFGWSQIDPDWLSWNPETYREMLQHEIARAGFWLDKEALDWCDTCVLLLPSGRSAHLEAG